MARADLPDYDEPVNIEGDPEEVLKILLGDPEDEDSEDSA
jgi:hypothetical protein